MRFVWLGKPYRWGFWPHVTGPTRKYRVIIDAGPVRLLWRAPSRTEREEG